MAQNLEEEYKKEQEVEIYDASKDRWIPGKIYDIREVDNHNIYCIEYEEYCLEIREDDARSSMRISKTDQNPNERNTKDAFLNFRKQIPTQSPVAHQMQMLLNNTRNTTTQRMIILYMKREYSMFAQ